MKDIASVILPLTQIRKLLKKHKISHRMLSVQLNITHPAITAILNGTYKGAEKTKQRVLNQIHILLFGMEKLQILIEENPDIFLKLLEYGIHLSRRLFDTEEKKILIQAWDYLKINKLKEPKEPN